MRAPTVYILVLWQCFNQINSEDRCLHHATNYSDTFPLVKTSQGEIRGLRQTQIDGRQNKTVTWSSFYVKPDI